MKSIDLPEDTTVVVGKEVIGNKITLSQLVHNHDRRFRVISGIVFIIGKDKNSLPGDTSLIERQMFFRKEFKE